MKKVKANVCFVQVGLLLAALLALGACSDEGWFHPGEETTVPEIGQKEEDLVSVRVVAGSGSRSVTTGMEQYLVNKYEVIFRGNSKYYRTVSFAPEGIITTELPAGKYKVMLLAGLDNGTLLGAAASPNQEEIVAGVSKVIKLTLSPTYFQWDLTGQGTNHFNFTVDVGNNSFVACAEERYINLPTIGDSTKFKMSISSSPLTNLTKWNIIDTGDKVTLAKVTAELRPWLTYANGEDVGNQAGFATIPILKLEGEDLTMDPTNNSTIDSSAIDLQSLKGIDSYGVLIFEMQYYAFGVQKSGGDLWYIRNGVDRTIDDSQSPIGGNKFLVKIGSPKNAYVVVEQQP
ncbi:MAG: hypothetical protein LBD74_06690 [Spirochaetaceae bacterium]|jgi:hypothetical protein|nr:hypothetical protein [Spirochaetaceae bacterium]